MSWRIRGAAGAAALVFCVAWVPGLAGAEPLKIGVAEGVITPEVSDHGPAVWLAGFSTGRRATGVHDDLYARAMYLELGEERIVLVGLDLVGYFYTEVVACRELLRRRRPDLGDVHLMIASTHNHEGPDTLGLWGPLPMVPGVDPEYMKRVRAEVVAVAAAAADRAVPARVRFAEAKTEGLIADSRLPRVIHDTIHLMHADRVSDGRPIGSLVLWHSHPEALGDENSQITADFPKYLVDQMEGSLGGTTVYLTGTIGGLLGPLGVSLRDGRTGQEVPRRSFQHAEQIGRRAARAALAACRRSQPEPIDRLDLKVQQIDLPLANPFLRMTAGLVLHDRPLFTQGRPDRRTQPLEQRIAQDDALRRSWARLEEEIGRAAALVRRLPVPVGEDLRTELNVVTLGPLQLITIPGELYPELALGRIQDPQDPAADFPGAEPEPALLEMMHGRYRWIVGLANDELGYILPKSQWDTEPPYTYGADKPPYGEILSLGPETAGRIARAYRELLRPGRGLRSATAGGTPPPAGDWPDRRR